MEAAFVFDRTSRIPTVRKDTRPQWMLCVPHYDCLLEKGANIAGRGIAHHTTIVSQPCQFYRGSLITFENSHREH
jgi:hypothetical protein